MKLTEKKEAFQAAEALLEAAGVQEQDIAAILLALLKYDAQDIGILLHRNNAVESPKALLPGEDFLSLCKSVTVTASKSTLHSVEIIE